MAMLTLIMFVIQILYLCYAFKWLQDKGYEKQKLINMPAP